MGGGGCSSGAQGGNPQGKSESAMECQQPSLPPSITPSPCILQVGGGQSMSATHGNSTRTYNLSPSQTDLDGAPSVWRVEPIPDHVYVAVRLGHNRGSHGRELDRPIDEYTLVHLHMPE